MTASLFAEAVLYVDEPRRLWEMTGCELDCIIAAGKRRRAAGARELETLAFNIGALVMYAFNAPQRFPRSPETAFGRRIAAPADGGKADLMAIAEQINRRFDNRSRIAGRKGEAL